LVGYDPDFFPPGAQHGPEKVSPVAGVNPGSAQDNEIFGTLGHQFFA
jgi:hypothetical protein